MAITKEKNKGGRPKGTPKTGGRQKGTPNKDNPLKVILRAHSSDYFTKPLDKSGATQFDLDCSSLTPDDRVSAELKLLEFHQPKLKAIDANITTDTVQLSIVDKLRELSEE